MTIDNLEDFAFSTVQAAPSPATSGTSLSVQTGDGALFPSGEFDLTCWPPGVLPLKDNAEIARATFSGDAATLTRNAYGYGAQAIAAGWQVGQVITKNLLEQIIRQTKPE